MLRRLMSSEFSFKSLAFEVVVVVLGVLIALGVGELQQDWEENRRARQTVEALYVELSENCLSLNDGAPYNEAMLGELNGLLSRDPLAVGVQRLPSFDAERGVINRPYMTSVTFEAAQATGMFRLLSFDTVRDVSRAYTYQAQYDEILRAVTPRLLDAAPPDDPDGLDLRVVRRLLTTVVNKEKDMRPVVCAARDALAQRFDLSQASLSETGSSDTETVQGRMLLPDTD
jgi:hypothetical protein